MNWVGSGNLSDCENLVGVSHMR